MTSPVMALRSGLASYATAFEAFHDLPRGYEVVGVVGLRQAAEGPMKFLVLTEAAFRKSCVGTNGSCWNCGCAALRQN